MGSMTPCEKSFLDHWNAVPKSWPPSARVWIFCAVAVIPSSAASQSILKGYTTCPWGSRDCSPCVSDVADAIRGLRRHATPLGFYLENLPRSQFRVPDPTVTQHWQGIQRLSGRFNSYLVVTLSRNEAGRAGFAVVKMASRTNYGERYRSNRLLRDVDLENTGPPSKDGVVHYQLTDTRFPHPGGIQLVGDWLVVPLEGSNGPNAKIVFYDLALPFSPREAPFEVDITNPASNRDYAGTASIAKLSDGRYLLIRGGNNARPLTLYMSAGTTLDNDPAFQFIGEWVPPFLNPPIWPAFQNLNIVTECGSGDLFLIGTHNNSPIGALEDWVFAYRLRIMHSDDAATPTTIVVEHEESRHLYCSYGPRTTVGPVEFFGGIGDQCNFDAAAGVYVSSAGELLLYGTEHDNDGPFGSVKAAEFRNQYHPSRARPTDPTLPPPKALNDPPSPTLLM